MNMWLEKTRNQGLQARIYEILMEERINGLKLPDGKICSQPVGRARYADRMASETNLRWQNSWRAYQKGRHRYRSQVIFATDQTNCRRHGRSLIRASMPRWALPQPRGGQEARSLPIRSTQAWQRMLPIPADRSDANHKGAISPDESTGESHRRRR